MKITLMVFGLMLASSQAMAGKYALSCYDASGRAYLKFKASDLDDVSGMSGNQAHYSATHVDGRILYVPQSNCVVEELKRGQQSILPM